MLWKGYTWNFRDGGIGGPGFAGWSANNIVGPDANDYVTLRLTNSGNSPVGAEMEATQSLGYGTYTLVVGSRLDNLDKNVVFGGLFPYFGGTPFIEFDVCEVSSWDGDGDFGNGVVYVSHNSWYGNPANPSRSHNSAVMDSGQVHTFVLRWEDRKSTRLNSSH